LVSLYLDAIALLEVLTWGVIGLLSCQRVALSEWGEVVSSRAQFASSHERRFARWLSNPHIKIQPYYTPLLKAALATWPKTQRLRLALDSSCLPTGLLLVQVALIYRGRAIPLSWSVIAQAGATVGYQVYEPLLLAACALLADFSQIELTADRGFFHQQLLRFCFKHHWHFRLRASRDTIVVAADQSVASLVQLCPPRGAVSFIHRVEVFGVRLGPVHLALANPAWTVREDPWYLISDEPTDLTTFDEYGERFDVEEGFLDDKSGGFQVEASEVKGAEAWERLFLILAVATLHLTAIGTAVVARGARRWVDTHWERGISYFKLGWRWWRQHALKGWPALFTFSLDPTPDPHPTRASRRPSPTHPWQFTLFPLPP
jgi:hypothetical protein